MNTNTAAPWQSVRNDPPPDRLLVETKIDDHEGVRNEAQLRRLGDLWFMPDWSMYVYYTPTHWRVIAAGRTP